VRVCDYARLSYMRTSVLRCVSKLLFSVIGVLSALNGLHIVTTYRWCSSRSHDLTLDSTPPDPVPCSISTNLRRVLVW
jgi:hypothetical protein